jgi:hypothetical protein
MQCIYLNRFILVGVLAFAVWSCGTPQKASQPAAREATSPPDAFAAEALATYQLQRDGARSLTLINEAVRRAPQRADLTYLQISLCRLIDGCPPQSYEAQLRKVDSANAAVWTHALADAQKRHEPAVEAQVLEAIGRGQRFDVYWNSLAVAVASARIGNGAAADAALNETVSWLGSTIVPAFQPLTLSCAPGRTGKAVWADRCRRVAEVLMNSDTLIAERIGLALARQVTADPIELAKLAERERTARYLWRESGKIITSQVERDKFSLELIELMRNVRREQDVHLAVMRWAGRPVMPPPGWQDGDG